MGTPSGETRSGGEVRVLTLAGDDAELLERLRRGHVSAAAMLYDRYARDVNRMVWRLLGADSEHDDLVQRVFLELLRSATRVRDATKLRGFVIRVTVNTVRSELRRRSVRRRFSIGGIEDPDRFEGPSIDHEARALLRETFDVIEKLPIDERLVFTLRYIDHQPMEAVADACDCSLSTAKRRLGRADGRFVKLARRHPGLAERLERSSRWGGA